MIFFFTMPDHAFDRRAIEALYRSHGGLVQRRARAMLGNDADALDAVQNIFVRLLKNPESFQGRSQPSTFLYAVTTNHCLATLRDRNNRQRIVDDKVVHELPTSVPPTTDARGELRLLLARLPEDAAAVAVYYYIDEMTQDQIAAQLSCSRRTVSALLEQCQRVGRELTKPATPMEVRDGR